MARIPESEIERIKREVSLERVVSTRVSLKKHGTNLLGLCPFHDDKEPSLVITPSKNLWNCLGACQTGGTVIDWVMKTQGVSFRHAVELLKADVALPAPEKVAKKSTVAKLPPPVDAEAEDAEALRQVVSFYRRTFEETSEAKAYLESRGLSHPDLGDFFSLGFANRTLGYRLPQANRRAGAELRGRLQRLGVLRKSGHEHMNGSLVVPLFSEDGDVADLYGRKITPGLRKGTPLHLYLPGPHAGVFNWPGLGHDDVILCESVLDAMTFWCAGFRNVTTSYGVSGFTDELRAALQNYQVRRVLIAYDRDDAGDAAAQKLAPELAADGMAVYRILFPKGMDANAYAQKMSPAGAAIDLVIRQAVWMAGKTSAPLAPVDEPKPTKKSEAIAPTKTEPAPKKTTTPAPHEDAPPASTKKPEVAIAPPAEPAPKKTTPAPTPKPPAPESVKAPPGDAMVREASPGGAEPKTPSIEPEESAHELVYRFGERRLRVRGLSNNKSYDLLKVNLFITHQGRFFVDTVDLYQARQRAAFLKQAADELELPLDLLKEDLGKVILSLEQIQEKALAEESSPKNEAVTLTKEEREEALGLLRDPHLMRRILGDFERLGVVGEETNKLVGYLATVSRKLDRPLAVIVQSSSAAGKSSLMEAVLAMVPEEERIKYSAMTGQSLYYLGETDLKHKILAIVEEEGAERASYALKLLQSEGELTIASTGKDPQTGQLKTNEYHVEGPVMIFLTTTAIEIDEELLNRCLVLTVDEGSKQTEAIHQSQRKGRTLAGLFGQRERASLLSLHNNAQRLLRRLPVVNPYAERLTFSANKTRTRRDHMKYLTLIDTVALLGQYQRATKTAMHAGEPVEYIEVTPADIAVANQLAHQVLGRTLDELPPQTRRLLGLLQDMVDAECKAQEIDRLNFRFSRRQVREVTGWGNTQLKLHLGRLVEMEYLVLHRTHHAQRYLYELSFDGRGGGPYLSGLIDPEQLDPSYEQNRSGQNGDRSGSGRPEVGGWSGGGRPDETTLLDAEKREKRRNGRSISKKRTSGAVKNGASYAKPRSTSAKA